MLRRGPVTQLRDHRQMQGSFANQGFLLFGWVEEAEAVLKSPAIADFSCKALWHERTGKIQFQLYALVHFQFAGNSSSHSALADVFGSSVERDTGLDDQALVHRIPRR
jgi:hypothetical protein